MMRDMFFYKKIHTITKKVKNDSGEEVEEKVPHEVMDCFNVNCVVRAEWSSLNTFVILLNDGHEQSGDTQVPIYKKGVIIGQETKRQRDWYHSQVVLTADDAKRFMELTSLA